MGGRKSHSNASAFLEPVTDFACLPKGRGADERFRRREPF
jgi:hypothetical protein